MATLPFGLEDVNPVGETIEEGSGYPFPDQNLGPGLRGEVGGHLDAGLITGPADDLEEEFRSGLGKGEIAEFVEDDESGVFQPPVESLEGPFLPSFRELGDQAGDGEEPDPPASFAACRCQACCPDVGTPAAMPEHASILIIGVSHDVEGTRHHRQALDGGERASKATLSKRLCLCTG